MSAPLRELHLLGKDLFETTCPNCGKEFDVPSEASEGDCPHCGITLEFMEEFSSKSSGRSARSRFLRRPDRTPGSDPLDALDAPKKTLDSLRKAGIRDTQELLGADEVRLAEGSGLPPKEVRRLQDMADLIHLHGVGPERAALLVDCDINSVRELAMQEVDDLLPRIKRQGRAVTGGDVLAWIHEAREVAPPPPSPTKRALQASAMEPEVPAEPVVTPVGVVARSGYDGVTFDVECEECHESFLTTEDAHGGACPFCDHQQTFERGDAPLDVPGQVDDAKLARDARKEADLSFLARARDHRDQEEAHPRLHEEPELEVHKKRKPLFKHKNAGRRLAEVQEKGRRRGERLLAAGVVGRPDPAEEQKKTGAKEKQDRSAAKEAAGKKQENGRQQREAAKKEREGKRRKAEQTKAHQEKARREEAKETAAGQRTRGDSGNGGSFPLKERIKQAAASSPFAGTEMPKILPDRPTESMQCAHCDHEFTVRKDQKKATCPGCHSRLLLVAPGEEEPKSLRETRGGAKRKAAPVADPEAKKPTKAKKGRSKEKATARQAAKKRAAKEKKDKKRKAAKERKAAKRQAAEEKKDKKEAEAKKKQAEAKAAKDRKAQEKRSKLQATKKKADDEKSAKREAKRKPSQGEQPALQTAPAKKKERKERRFLVGSKKPRKDDLDANVRGDGKSKAPKEKAAAKQGAAAARKAKKDEKRAKRDAAKKKRSALLAKFKPEPSKQQTARKKRRQQEKERKREAAEAEAKKKQAEAKAAKDRKAQEKASKLQAAKKKADEGKADAAKEPTRRAPTKQRQGPPTRKTTPQPVQVPEDATLWEKSVAHYPGRVAKTREQAVGVWERSVEAGTGYEKPDPWANADGSLFARSKKAAPVRARLLDGRSAFERVETISKATKPVLDDGRSPFAPLPEDERHPDEQPMRLFGYGGDKPYETEKGFQVVEKPAEQAEPKKRDKTKERREKKESKARAREKRRAAKAEAKRKAEERKARRAEQGKKRSDAAGGAGETAGKKRPGKPSKDEKAARKQQKTREKAHAKQQRRRERASLLGGPARGDKRAKKERSKRTRAKRRSGAGKQQAGAAKEKEEHKAASKKAAKRSHQKRMEARKARMERAKQRRSKGKDTPRSKKAKRRKGKRKKSPKDNNKNKGESSKETKTGAAKKRGKRPPRKGSSRS